ncbi:MAG: ATP-dependent protease La [Piptocephalis tieghemiana]|nr:MAG: ATP-dependent protease La [Piptocephalis tieghemiana]
MSLVHGIRRLSRKHISLNFPLARPYTSLRYYSPEGARRYASQTSQPLRPSPPPLPPSHLQPIPSNRTPPSLTSPFSLTRASSGAYLAPDDQDSSSPPSNHEGGGGVGNGDNDGGDDGDPLNKFQRAIDIVESSASSSSSSSSDGDSGHTVQRPQIPEVYPQLLVIPIARRPLFPGFYKAVVVTDPAVKKAIRELVKRGQPYVGTFLLKDDDADSDVISSVDQVYRIGTFAQITNAVEGDSTDEGPMTVVLYPHRRIRISRMVQPKEDGLSGTEGQDEATYAMTEEAQEETTKPSQDALEKEKTQGGELDSTSPPSSPIPGPPVSVVRVENIQDEPYRANNPLIRAVMQEIVSVFKDIASLNPLFRDQIATFSIRASGSGNAFEDPGKLADFAAAVSAGESKELQGVLDSVVVEDRLQGALFVLKKELMNAQLQGKIRGDVESKIHKRQRDFYLMEQLRSIKKELGLETDGKDKLVEEFKVRASKLTMPDAVSKVFDEELGKLSHLEPAASEFNVTRNYLDWLTQIPWGKRTPENFDLAHAVKVLEEDHYGLEDVKDRILEFIAVGKLKGTVQGKIICLVGPPGVGKTSIGKSVARALSREFYRFSVGGLTDVAEIKGHRRTYVGAMPGKMVQALKKVQTDNPLILIDEIDKIGRGHQGDPSSALLELLDPEQNSSFLDHYMDVPIDLSGVLFVCTANVLDTIPGPLLDRMEVIQLSGYVADEKAAIASKYLGPAARKDAGLEGSSGVILQDDAIHALIRSYCRESGVRNLKKHIDKIYRKAALKLVRKYLPEDSAGELEKSKEEGPVRSEDKATGSGRARKTKAPSAKSSSSKSSEKPTTSEPTHTNPLPKDASLVITEETLKDYVGPPVFTSDRLYDITPPGVVMGLAWTSMGGSALYVESILAAPLKPLSTPLTTTSSSISSGNGADVMKESTSIAYTYAKSWLAKHRPDSTFFSQAAIHLHVPEGATPKDGPSAGITMTSSLLSLALDKPLSPTVAMTGEITLTGKVLKIGGLKEKTIAAKRSGITTILFPEANLPDWEDLPKHIKEGMEGVPVAWYDEVAPRLNLLTE